MLFILHKILYKLARLIYDTKDLRRHGMDKQQQVQTIKGHQ